MVNLKAACGLEAMPRFGAGVTNCRLRGSE